MTIARYLLTLILAAIASSFAYLLVRDAPAIVQTISHSDPRLAAGVVSSAIMSLLLGIPGAIVLGYLVWRFVSLVFLRPAMQAQSWKKYLTAGVLTHGLLYGVFAILYSFGSEGFDPDNLILSTAAVFVAGAMWGLIFWKMDPRSSDNVPGAVEEF